MAMQTHDADAVNVLLTTEGTFPFFQGGVSTWCDALVNGVEGTRYLLYAVISHPYVGTTIALPQNVKLIRMPLWGTEEAAEVHGYRYGDVYERKMRTTDPVIKQRFIPLFNELMTFVLGENVSGVQVGVLFMELYRYFSEYDYMTTFKNSIVWHEYLKGLQKNKWKNLPQEPTLYEAQQSFGWIYRFFVVISASLPKSDVTHSSAAAFCGIPGIISKIHHKTPFMLTEHGVYLREQYLAIGKSAMSDFLKRFLIGLVRMVVAANYAYSDVVTPVALYNARWEERLGVARDKIQVIYNGVEEQVFSSTPSRVGQRPTVVSVARIDPVKDIEGLIRSAAIVKEKIPNVLFAIYGGISVPSYYALCLRLREQLGLETTVMFLGHMNDIATAYTSGDVVVLSSITEGLPYAVVEAMMSAKPVVATDVGGIGEALGDCGILVSPQNPEDMARGIVTLLQDDLLRQELGDKARKRALALFTRKLNLQNYQDIYSGLSRFKSLTL